MTATEEAPRSLECIKTSELYPKKPLFSEDKALQVPFPHLTGECVEYLGRTVDGVIALSNFRLVIHRQDTFVNIPLGLVELIESRDIFYLHIYCKDATVVRCAFATNDTCLEWFKRLSVAAAPPKKLDLMFAFAFHAWCQDGNPCPSDFQSCYQLCQQHNDDKSLYSFSKEVDRMNFDLKSAWRISYINEDFKACSSYSSEHIVPASVTDKDLQSVVEFRALNRFPSVVWRDQRNGAVLMRSSQPELGWLGWRNEKDEKLLMAIPQACQKNPGIVKMTQTTHENGSSPDSEKTLLPHDCEESRPDDAEGELENGINDPGGTASPKMLIIDARSYGAAFANRAKGGGCECAEYYPSCEIQFMSLANIHSVRKSFQSLRMLCAGGPDQINWLSSLETTKWLHNIAALIRASVVVINAVDKEARPVLVHCSDGWDRTSQIIALAELLLDPYYRTMEGFQVLIEREWLEFGHKFADRCGHSVSSEDTNERCPVFMQWLDCVHQCLVQFPCAFEFNEAYLVKLIQHTYSCLFGTFLCNSPSERQKEHVLDRTSSVWSLLRLTNRKFYNYLYLPCGGEQVLRPSCHVRNMSVWSAVYLLNNTSKTKPNDFTNTSKLADDISSASCLVNHNEKVESVSISLQKTRSCDDIVAALEHSTNANRRLSDPNLVLDTLELVKHPVSKDSDATVTETTSLTDHITSLNSQQNDNAYFNGYTNGYEELSRAPVSDDSDSDINILDTVNEDVNQVKMEFIHPRDESLSEEVARLKYNGLLVNGHSAMNGDCDIIDDCDTCSESNLLASKSNSSRTLTGSSLSLDRGTAVNVDSSTDTIIDDENLKSQRSGSLSNVISTAALQNGQGDDDQVLHLNNSVYKYKKSPVLKVKTIDQQQSSSISTSTSDLSDYNVMNTIRIAAVAAAANSECTKFQEALLNLKLPLRSSSSTGSAVLLKLNCEKANSSSSSMCTCESSGGKSAGNSRGNSVPSTPACSSSCGSTCPTTPGTENSGKTSLSPLQRHMTGLGCHLDTDGLTTFEDPAQRRLQEMETEHHQKIENLLQQLDLMKMALYTYTSVGCANGVGRALMGETARDDVLSLPESCGSDLQSLGNCSNAASDVSWEQLDEKDSDMTLWVPDHAVTHCAGCQNAFWIAKRRHHCRNCGNVFCGDCANNYIPIPQQQLKDPARVCLSCFSKIAIHFDPSQLPPLSTCSEPGVADRPIIQPTASAKV